MDFQPRIGDDLLIGGVSYQVSGHPAAPTMPYAQEGRQAIVYQVAANGRTLALKVHKPLYRSPALVAQAAELGRYASLPGLEVCAREVLTPQRDGDLLRRHRDLLYAVLMPWVAGPTWLEVLWYRRPLSAEQSLSFARALAGLLAQLEERGLAHGDLSAPNLMLPGLADQPSGSDSAPIALVDVEQLHGQGMGRPDSLPGASDGYAHRTGADGLWSEQADRFAGSVLIAELLGWCDDGVRAQRFGESYFAPDELQREGERARLLTQVLTEVWGDGIAGLFLRAWQSNVLGDCPAFGQWLVELPAAPRSVPVDRAPVLVGAGGGADPPTTVQADPAMVQRLVASAEQQELSGDIVGAVTTYGQAAALLPEGSALREELELMRQRLVEQEATGPIGGDGARAVTVTEPRPGWVDESELHRDELAMLFTAGLAAAQQGRRAEAIELLSEVVRQNPKYRWQGQEAAALLKEVRRGRRPLPARFVALAAALIVLALAAGSALALNARNQQTSAVADAAQVAAAATVGAERLLAGVTATAQAQGAANAVQAVRLAAGATATAAASAATAEAQQAQLAAMATATAGAVGHLQATVTAGAIAQATTEAALHAQATAQAQATAAARATATAQSQATPTSTPEPAPVAAPAPVAPPLAPAPAPAAKPVTLVALPNLVGDSYGDVEQALKNAGLAVQRTPDQPSTTVAAGLVLAQQPAAGSRVPQGSAVTITVSSGPPALAVPNVVGQAQADAVNTLKQAGFQVSAQEQSSTGTPGLVLSQNPGAGAAIPPGSTVTLAVSALPRVTVPNLVGMAEGQAQAAIKAAGLTPTYANHSGHDSSVAVGSVESQQPTAGSVVTVGTTVYINVRSS